MFDEEQVLEQVEPVVEQPQQSEVEVAAQALQTKQELNFREMREKNKQLERERDAALRLMEEEKLRNKYASQPQQEYQEQQLADDDIPDVGYVKKQLAKVQQELAAERERQAADRQKYEQQNAITRLAAEYPDYADLLADRNIELLRSLEPELMASIDGMTDTYARGKAAIKAAKAFGVASHDPYKNQKAAIQQQASKPKAVNALNPSSSNSALNQAHNFSGVMDDAERQRVYLEAVRRSRGQ